MKSKNTETVRNIIKLHIQEEIIAKTGTQQDRKIMKRTGTKGR
jgi:hypothetical protein